MPATRPRRSASDAERSSAPSAGSKSKADSLSACFERLQSEGSLAAVKTRFRDFGGLARITALLGLVFAFFAVAIGPLAVYYAVKALGQKKEMEETDGKAGIRVALVAGVLETVLGLVLLAVWIAALRT